MKALKFLLVFLMVFSMTPAEAITVTDQVQSSSLSFYSNIQGSALNLLFGLFSVAFAWKTISLVLKRAEFQEIVVAAIKAMIGVGVYTMFIQNGDVWLKTIVDGSKMMASQGAGISLTMLNPGAIMGLGIDLQDSMVKTFNAASGADSFIGAITNFFPALEIMIACLMIMFSFAMIAFNLFLAYCEMYIIIAIAPFMFALGGTEWTKDNALKPFQSMIAVSVKIMILAIVANIAIQSTPGWATQLAEWKIDDWRPMWTVAFQILSIGILALLAPKLASAILAGGSSMSAGDAIQAGGNIGGMATGAGAIALGAAAAGAGVAGKAAAEAGGAGKALLAGFDQNRMAGMGFGSSAIQAPVPGIKSVTSMAGAKLVETGKNLSEGSKGMLGKAGEAINNSAGGKVASHISGGNSPTAGEQNSTDTTAENSTSSTPPGNTQEASIGGGNSQPAFQAQTPQAHAKLLDKLAHMRNFLPPEGMVSGASVSHVHND